MFRGWIVRLVNESRFLLFNAPLAFIVGALSFSYRFDLFLHISREKVCRLHLLRILILTSFACLSAVIFSLLGPLICRLSNWIIFKVGNRRVLQPRQNRLTRYLLSLVLFVGFGRGWLLRWHRVRPFFSCTTCLFNIRTRDQQLLSSLMLSLFLFAMSFQLNSISRINRFSVEVEGSLIF